MRKEYNFSEAIANPYLKGYKAMKVAVMLDDSLLSEAIKITGINQKRLLINEALSELIRLYKMRGLLSLENSDIWESAEGSSLRIAL